MEYQGGAPVSASLSDKDPGLKLLRSTDRTPSHSWATQYSPSKFTTRRLGRGYAHFSGNSTSQRSLPSSVIAMTTWSFLNAMALLSNLAFGNWAQSWAGPTAFAESSTGNR